ncbi:MAG TPA: MFS transporter, partial [Methanoregulaceae archaeon]|nr:MFS transporter [Methanoregulaceae archaeon]
VGAGGIGVAITGLIADTWSLPLALTTVLPLLAVATLLYAVLPYPWKSGARLLSRLRTRAL